MKPLRVPRWFRRANPPAERPPVVWLPNRDSIMRGEYRAAMERMAAASGVSIDHIDIDGVLRSFGGMGLSVGDFGERGKQVKP